MDRISPTQRPTGRNAGTQSWRDLLFVHWPVPVAELRPLVPPALELDLLDGEAFVGVVPFAMRKIRTAFMPRGTGLNFLETNVRTYVHHKGREPGVYFFSLDASSRLAVRAARWGWRLPYFDAKMQLDRRGDELCYRSVRQGVWRDAREGGATFEARWSPGATLGPSQPGSAEHFLLERYNLYAQRGTTLLRGRVNHPAYAAREAQLHQLDETLVRAAGLSAPAGPPRFVHACDGVDVEVFSLRPA